jgi:hypothetical protein
MKTIVQAIADFEGFYVAHSRAQRNNNPGNINFGKMAKAYGAVLETVPTGTVNEVPRFAHFPTVDNGWTCLRDLLVNNYHGMTVLDAFNKYAPPSENNTVTYASYICKETGLKLTDVLTADDIG